jgi:hypothetical protein
MSDEIVCGATTKFALFDLHVPASAIKDLLDKPDALAAAGQLGRLDFFSGLLAAFAIIISLGAVFAFIEVRAKAARSARDAALKEVKEIAPNEIKTYLSANPQFWVTVLRENPWIIEGAVRRVQVADEMPADQANAIAEAMSKEEDGHDDAS